MSCSNINPVATKVDELAVPWERLLAEVASVFADKVQRAEPPDKASDHTFASYDGSCPDENSSLHS
jgi:hypothetical protein